ncbi:MAG: bifunctional phosphoribosyl-AMP cyclohydrolase/phosphoribosyl-ATP diphosphatase HisIE [Holophagaceae bacterium]|nr:bifunctional phosphoribosyl-AMP cyclohydrolase/phosphoribosyl-ATP diphosphatase HisIE [Holophagaceae bacterium]
MQAMNALRLNPNLLHFDETGLIPAVVQGTSGEVRMVGYLNRDALEKTLQSGFVTFWSRSRQTLWTKGEGSGNRLKLVELRADCDHDCLLIIAEPIGPTCHRGTGSCFDDDAAEGPEAVQALEASAATTLPWLDRLERLLQSRKATASLTGSYTRKLFAQGTDRIAKKVVEEAGEVVLAAKNLERESTQANRDDFLGEAADLVFHLELLLVDRGLSLHDVVALLKARHIGRSGK